MQNLFAATLAGLANAYNQHHRTLAQQDVERRKQLSDTWEKLSQDPNYPADKREFALRQSIESRMAPLDKKFPKQFEDFTQFFLYNPQGRPVPDMGAAPAPQPPPQPTPGAAGFPIKQEAPPVPSIGREAFINEGFRMPSRYSDDELIQRVIRPLQLQKEAEAYALKAGELRATFEPQNIQAALELSRGTRNVDPNDPAVRMRNAAIELEQYKRQRDYDVTNPAPTPDIRNYEYEMDQREKAGLPAIPMDQWWQDRARRDPLMTVIRELEIRRATGVAPGQVIATATGLPINLDNTASDRIAAFKNNIEQAQVTRDALQRAGRIGAIKGWAIINGVYFPIAQDIMTPEQAAAMSEAQRLANNTIRAVSGAATSIDEVRRNAATLPSIRYTPQTNESIINHYERYERMQLYNYMNVRGWSFAPGSSQYSPWYGAGKSGEGKLDVVTSAQVKQYAADERISYEEALRAFEADGFIVSR